MVGWDKHWVHHHTSVVPATSGLLVPIEASKLLTLVLQISIASLHGIVWRSNIQLLSKLRTLTQTFFYLWFILSSVIYLILVYLILIIFTVWIKIRT